MIRHKLLIILCLAVAFQLRVWGLDFGLPYEFHPDEHQYVDAALALRTTGQANLSFINPPFFTYVLAAAFSGWLVASPSTPAPDWVTPAYFFARLWSVGFGMLTVALIYPVARRCAGPRAGLLALLLLAGLFLPAREAHFAVNDTAATFWVLLALYFSLALLRRGRRRLYLAAGAAVGLAAATKLTAGLAVLPLLAAHFLRTRSRRDLADVALSLGVAALVFGLVFGHVLVDLPQLFETIVDHLAFGAEGYKGLQMAPLPGWGFYLYVLGWGAGWLILAVMVWGLALVFGQRHRAGLVVASLPMALFAYLGAQKILFARFLLPAVPALVVLAALGLVWLSRRWSIWRQQPRPVWSLIVGLLLAQPLAYLIWFNHLLTLPDTRELATTWFTRQFESDTVTVLESYSILPATFWLGRSWPYKTIQLNERGPTRADLDYYLQHKTDLIVVSNFTSARVRANTAEEAARRRQLALLAERAEALIRFDPYRAGRQPAWFYLDELYGPAGETLSRVRPGPLIEIYRLPAANQPYQTEMPAIAAPLKANFADTLLLLGYDLPQRRVEPGGTIPLTLYWQALRPMSEVYVVFNRLLDANQQPWGGYDRWPQETSKTTLWQPGEIVIDTFGLPVAPDAPPGVYTIDLGLYNQADATAAPLPLVQAGQSVGQNSVRLGPVKVAGPPAGVLVSPGSIEPQHAAARQLGDPPVIALRGYDLAAGEHSLTLRLYWECLAHTPVDWSIFAHLRGADGQIVAQKDGPAGGQLGYPTSLWDTGEIIVDEATLVLPVDLTGGEYRLVIGLYNLVDGTRLPVSDLPDREMPLTTGEPDRS